ncbi:MAG: Uma2 family endonuclease [Cyanobacteria bacterium P01_F01_bin.150]
MNLITQPISQISFEQYMAGEFECPWSDCRWESGEIVPVPPEYGENNEISQYLFFQFRLHIINQGLDMGTCIKDTDIEVNSTKHRTRKPDVMVLSADTRAALRGRSAVITKAIDPPLIIVEVISKNYRNIDLVEKKQEYLDRQVPEYWTVEWDCAIPTIIVRTFDAATRSYRSHQYQNPDVVQSTILPNLKLTVNQIIAAQ